MRISFRLCSLTLTRLVLNKPLGPELNSVIIAVKMQVNQYILFWLTDVGSDTECLVADNYCLLKNYLVKVYPNLCSCWYNANIKRKICYYHILSLSFNTDYSEVVHLILGTTLVSIKHSLHIYNLSSFYLLLSSLCLGLRNNVLSQLCDYIKQVFMTNR